MKRIKKNILGVLSNKVTILLVITTFLTVVSSTYAYFTFSIDNRATITGDMATVNLELNIERVLPTKESTGVMVPQKSVSGSSNSPLASALKKGCVDDNNNVVCQVYKITVANNTGTAKEVVDGYISFYSNQAMTESSEIKMPNLSWKLITSVDLTNNNNSILGTNLDNTGSGTPAKFVQNVELSSNQSDTKYMIIWFNEINEDQIDKGNTFYGKVSYESSNGTGITAVF